MNETTVEVESDSNKYAAWIAKVFPERGDAYGACKVACESMCSVFPELRLARGHYNCPIWGPREHWWLVDANGEIVDPTAHQFPSAGLWPSKPLGKYEELSTDAEEPIGRCMTCGEYCWRGKSPSLCACSAECDAELRAEYNISD